MSNYVLKYSRDERVRYISHLDFVRMFHRAVRRSGLLMSFSQGFNPHPIMTVAMPLSVGVTADGELMKIGFEEEYTGAEIMEALNRALPDGFRIVAAAKAEGKNPDFSKLDRAVYTVELETKAPIDLDLEKFLQNPALLVMKKSKSGVRESDIRPHIFWMRLEASDGCLHKISMCVSAGNQYNLKPDTVIEAMEKYIDDFFAEFFMVHRNAMLAGNVEYCKE